VCDRHTIHRDLSDCGTHFSAVLDAQRAELVSGLIEDGNYLDLPICAMNGSHLAPLAGQLIMVNGIEVKLGGK
jgi:hypothetical protein